ncbi:MAG TPA: carboxypeptidase-like regulatory domain-containing protein [Candidatus Acidoferrum sp.]
MFDGPRRLGFAFFILLNFIIAGPAQGAPASWRGVLRDANGNAVAGATITLHATGGTREYSAMSTATGDFTFAEIAEGTYWLRVTVAEKIWNAAD